MRISLLLFLSTLLLPAVHARIVDRIAAVVNSEVITLSEVYTLGEEYIVQVAEGEGPEGPRRREAELEVLDALIKRSLINQEVVRLGLEVTAEEIERTIDDIARQNGLDRAQLMKELERSGYEWSVYRNELEENIREMKFSQVVIEPRINVSVDEVQDLFNRRVKGLESGGDREVRGILLSWPEDAVPDERAELALEAAAVAGRIESEGFEAVAVGYPHSPYHASGGRMGTYAPGELVAALDSVVFSTPVGEVGVPVALDAGIMVVEVVAESGGERPEFDAVRSDLETELRAEKLEDEIELWYRQSRRQSSVEILLPTPEAH